MSFRFLTSPPTPWNFTFSRQWKTRAKPGITNRGESGRAAADRGLRQHLCGNLPLAHCTQGEPRLPGWGLLSGFGPTFRFHEVGENVIDARQVTFAFRFQPL